MAPTPSPPPSSATGLLAREALTMIGNTAGFQRGPKHDRVGGHNFGDKLSWGEAPWLRLQAATTMLSEGEEHCYGYGDAGGLAERRGLLQMMVPVLFASAALLLKL
ncbi:hypothetical protein HU200_024822 [Digitaria exilis]|uniref:Uncharacterized protein n=1 Tax=Digitaria exilis TaxID=1010633 RepID=A0A835EWB7_9POAL|nr:hypothetical protein HU200_024822 [Digitaria exilis]